MRGVLADYLASTVHRNDVFRGLLCQTILVLLCLASYHHALSGARFVFDDTVAIVKNKDVTTVPTNWTGIFHNDFWGSPLDSADSHKSYRPLTTLMFHFEYACLGLQAAHMKLLNLLLHCINTLLVWRFLRSLEVSETIDSERLATIAAALFAVHPVHTEAVAGVVGRAELMFCLLYLLCLLLTLCDDSIDGTTHVGTVVLLTAAGLLFKETAVTIPLACAFIDYMRREYYLHPLKLQLKLLIAWRYILLAVATVILVVSRLWWQNFEGAQFKPVDNPVAYDEQPLTRFLSQHYLYVVNFWLLVCPQWLSFDWALGCIKLVTNVWDLRLQAVFAFYSLITVACANFKRCVGLVTGLGLMVIPFLPAAGIIKVGFVIAERVLYVPSIGYCLLAAYGFLYCYNAFEKSYWLRTLLKWLLMLVFTCFLLRTRQRATEWLDEEKLFASALNVCPNNAKVHYNIARLATDRMEIDKAFRHYHKAVELHPNYESALMNLGNLYREHGQLETAEKYIREALSVVPNFAVAWMNLGIVLSARKSYSEALVSYEMALKHRKNYAVCYYNMGNLYLDQKRYTEALQHWQHAVALNPRQPKAWANILTMLDNRGLHEDALRLSAQALTHLTTEPTIMFIRANVFGKLKHYVEAETLYKRIIELKPNNMLYHTNLGVLYHRWNKIDAAIERYEKAIELDPNRATTALENLAKLSQRIAREKGTPT